jgi:hypothetical protein
VDKQRVLTATPGLTDTRERREERLPTGVMDGDRAMTISGAGAIPYRLRVGVIGHRRLPDDPLLVEQVDRALARVRQLVPSSPDTPIRLAVVSPLAEGADRLVARMVLADPETLLEVPLPLPLHDYQTDFTSEESKGEFQNLLARAVRVVELPACETRPEAYEQAGQYVVERCDVLIALWDGQPSRGKGGTAEIVEWARERRVPLFWIHTEPPFRIAEELGDGVAMASYWQLDAYNRASVKPAEYERQRAQQAAELATQAERAGLERTYLQPFCAWALPHFVRADMLALRFQQRFFQFSDAIFLFAAFAVAVAGATAVTGSTPIMLSTPLLPHVALLPLVELALMLLILLILFAGRRQGLHQRWIAYRFLAEQLRVAFFLALAGVPGSPKASAEHIRRKHPAEEWLQRALDEVWSQQPAPSPFPSCASLRCFLGVAWIQDQLAYQYSKSHRHERRYRLLTGATVATFAITLVITGLSAFGVVGHASTDDLIRNNGVAYLSIALPALAGALRGIGAQREHLRNVRRSGQMARYLAIIKKRMDRASNLTSVHALARQAEAVMLEENSDWFLTMEGHDVELHDAV